MYACGKSSLSDIHKVRMNSFAARKVVYCTYSYLHTTSTGDLSVFCARVVNYRQNLNGLP